MDSRYRGGQAHQPRRPCSWAIRTSRFEMSPDPARDGDRPRPVHVRRSLAPGPAVGSVVPVRARHSSGRRHAAVAGQVDSNPASAPAHLRATAPAAQGDSGVQPDPERQEARGRRARAGPPRRPPAAGGELWGPPGSTGTGLSDGPVTPWKSGVMTVKGTITATAVLFVLLLASATVGWMATESATPRPQRRRAVQLPRHRHARRDRRVRLRHRAVLQARVRQDPRPDLRPRPGLLRRRHLEGLRVCTTASSSRRPAPRWPCSP